MSKLRESIQKIFEDATDPVMDKKEFIDYLREKGVSKVTVHIRASFSGWTVDREGNRVTGDTSNILSLEDLEYFLNKSDYRTRSGITVGENRFGAIVGTYNKVVKVEPVYYDDTKSFRAHLSIVEVKE